MSREASSNGRLRCSLNGVPSSVDALRATAADLIGTGPQIVQPAGRDVLGHAAAVVGDLAGEVVFDADGDVQGVRPRVPHRVADGLADNGFGVVGQGRVDHRERSDKVHPGAQALAGKRRDGVVDALTQPGGSR